MSQSFDRLLDEGKKAPALLEARDFKRSFERPLAIQFNTPSARVCHCAIQAQLACFETAMLP